MSGDSIGLIGILSFGAILAAADFIDIAWQKRAERRTSKPTETR